MTARERISRELDTRRSRFARCRLIASIICCAAVAAAAADDDCLIESLNADLSAPAASVVPLALNEPRDSTPLPFGAGALLAQAAPTAAPVAPPSLPTPSRPAASDAVFTATVQGPTDASQLLRIVKDKSVILKLSRPINTASIAQPEVADVTILSPTQVVATGKKFGTTQLVLQTSDGQQLIYDVLVEINVQLLEELVKSIAPLSHVRAQSLFDTIVLTGSVPDSTTASRIAEVAELMSPGKVRNQMMVAGSQQVLIRCTVAEVNKTALRELGVNWFVGGTNWTRDFFVANNLDAINPVFVQNRGLQNLLVGQQVFTLLPYQNGAGNQNLTFGFPRADLQFFVQALRRNGLVRVLAEPNVTAINGQKATFLVGGEIPIPLALQNTFSVEYKKFGIQLEFVPFVEKGQIIRIVVRPEVSDVDPTRQIVVNGFAIPAFRTRRFESTVEVGNGQTFAMAGLLNETVRASASKIPGIGDVPVIGTLFSSVTYTRENTELIVLVTPELVAPLDPQQVSPVPGQLMGHPSDAELFLNQQLEGAKIQMPELTDVPRADIPVSVWPNENAAAMSRNSPALRGPYGMSYDDGDGQ